MWYVLQTTGTNGAHYGALGACVLGVHGCRVTAMRAAVAEYVHQSDGLVHPECTFAQMVQQVNAQGQQIVVVHA